jgi:hypothetical protein
MDRLTAKTKVMRKTATLAASPTSSSVRMAQMYRAEKGIGNRTVD